MGGILNYISSISEKRFYFAVFLGLSAASLPFLSPFLLIVLLILIFINIPLMVFLSSYLFFLLFSVLFKNFLAVIGYDVLTFQPLVPLFEAVYNLPFLRWSEFNNIYSMGLFVFGTFLIGVLWTVKKAFFKNSGFSTAGERFFRFSAGTSIGVLGTLILFVSFFADPLLKAFLEYRLTKALHKEVKIQKFSSSFINTDADIYDLSFGDFNAEHIYVKLSAYYLMWKKFDIKQSFVNNFYIKISLKELLLKSGTKKRNFKIMFPKPDVLIAGTRLEYPERVLKLQKDYEDYVDLKNSFERNLSLYNRHLDYMESYLQDMKKKGLPDKTELNTVKTTLTDLRQRTSLLLEKETDVKSELESVKTAMANDYTKLAEKYDNIKTYYMNIENIITTPKIQTYIKNIDRYYKPVKAFVRKNLLTKRYYDGYVLYKDKINYPDFIVENCVLNGKSDSEIFRLECYNISLDQLLDKKSVVKFSSIAKYYDSFILNITYHKKLNFNMSISNLRFDVLKLGDIVLNKARINIKSNGIVTQNLFEMNTNGVVEAESLIYKNSDIIKKIEGINDRFCIVLKKIHDRYKVDFKTTLAQNVSKEVQKEIARQIELLKLRLKKELEKTVENEIEKTGFNEAVFEDSGVRELLSRIERILSAFEDAGKNNK